jgi:hypothetical protein
MSHLADLIATLGTTPDEVAITLRARAIHGVRNTARFLNPVVRYIQSIIRVDALSVDVMTPGAIRMKMNGHEEVAVLPKPVVKFLDAFNGGKYPDLELPPEKM